MPSSWHPSRLCLPSTLLSIRIITKLFYQTFHIHLGPVHIFLGLVLRLLSFFRSVKLFLFLRVLPQPYLFLPLRKPRVQRWQSLAPIFRLYFFLNLIMTLTLTLRQFQVPTPNICADTCLVPDAFYRVSMLIWVRLIRFVRVHLLIPWFLVVQLVNNRSKTQTDQAHALWHIEPRAPLSPPVFELVLRIFFSLSLKKNDFCVELGFGFDFLHWWYHIWSLFFN